MQNWLVLSLFSALFAALTAILAKIGVKNIDSNLATAIRTVVILLFAWGIVFFQGTASALGKIPTVPLLFLVASGITTGLSWLFYFKALSIGNASQVAPIDKLSIIITIVLASTLLKEKLSTMTLLGGIMMTVGAVLIALG